jgi:hypothetical protein
MRYWINAVSQEHVMVGVAGGFTQADHGRATRLQLLAKGDGIVFYSPRTEFDGGKPLQAFTAIGRIADDEPFQVAMSAPFHPWRREVQFFECVEAPIRPLIESLAFIEDKTRWGFPFRRGLFDIDRVARAQTLVATS